jgi:predicted outer membrane repeat protein
VSEKKNLFKEPSMRTSDAACPVRMSLCVAMMAGVAAGTATADVLLVPSQFSTIQLAINSAADGDEIVVAPGTYFEQLDYLGKEVEVRGSGGAAVTILDGLGSSPVVRAVLGETLGARLRGFTVRGAISSGAGGSAVLISGSRLDLDACIIEGNQTANRGFAAGAVLVENGLSTISGTTFRNNQAEGFGGALALSAGANVSVSSSLFENNTVPDQRGGAIQAIDSTLTIAGSTFRNNRTSGGDAGAINAVNASVGVTDSLFEGNIASGGSGGAISLRSASTLGVIGSTFIGNQAQSGSGGAVAARDTGFITLDRCTLSSNSAPSGSGGAASGRGSAQVVITNSVLDGSLAPSGSGAAVAIRDTSGMFVINSTIVNSGQFAIRNSGSGTLNVANTIVRGGVLPATLGASINITYSNFEGGFVGTGNIDAPALFVNAAGGDYRLAAGSAGIDAGSNTASSGLLFDRGGEARFQDDAATADTGEGIAPIVDIGAFEFVGGCPADFNGDGFLDFFDYDDFVSCFEGTGTPGCDADFNGDGFVDFFDYDAFVGAFESGC